MLPIALLGSPELDVAQIDPATLVLWLEDEGISVGIRRETLEDVAAPADAEPCDCVETGPDGILDLVVKFSMRDLVPTLGAGKGIHRHGRGGKGRLPGENAHQGPLEGLGQLLALLAV